MLHIIIIIFAAIYKSSRNKKGYEKNQKKCDHHKYGKQVTFISILIASQVA
jgi:hypothetical protein